MSKHLNPLEKEFLIRQYKSNLRIKLSDFCEANHISDGAFKKWLKQYEEGGLEGLARADAEIREVLPVTPVSIPRNPSSSKNAGNRRILSSCLLFLTGT